MQTKKEQLKEKFLKNFAGYHSPNYNQIADWWLAERKALLEGIRGEIRGEIYTIQSAFFSGGPIASGKIRGLQKALKIIEGKE